MPFTPFHFGPHSCVALALQKHIDLPVFVLANVIVDLEPLTVMLLNLKYPVHGYCHTFLIGSILAIVWALIAYNLKGIFGYLMKTVGLSDKTSFAKMVFSGVLGIWLHVLFDAPLYRDIRPFYPFESNPLYGILSSQIVYGICAVSFVPALILYIITVLTFSRRKR